MRAPIAFAIGCIITTLFTDSVSAVHCNKHHTIVDGDTCKTIAKEYNISEKVIDRLNPAAHSVCDNLQEGLQLCVSSSIKSLNKASSKKTATSGSKKTVHTKQKMTTLIKPKKSGKKHSTKHTSKKQIKKVSAKKPTKTADGAIPTPAARHKDPKEGSAKADNVVPSGDASAQPTDAGSDASDDNSSAEPTDASPDASSAEPTDDSSAEPTDGAASNANPTPTDDGSDANAAPGAGPEAPSNSTASSNSTQSPALTYADHLTVQLTSAADFCLLLPSSPGGKKDNNNKMDVEAISKSEGSAISFCLKQSEKLAPKAREMPKGLIQSAYFYKNATGDYSQVSGTLNPKAYMLSDKDYGGQYDNHGKGAPANSMCYGYKYFVELIEPNNRDFCIRCCNVYEDCNAGRSAYGCKRVVSNGRYA
ncbi:hypothetical protein K501DRAFT_336732 [Backusella circina FSU 941]|nr:hypothetical protein K501DRAFT_336732 [Backusella circina FSU 941]